MTQDVASTKTLEFLLDGPIHSMSQAAMVFCLMNPDIHSTVPGIKNVSEIEEIAGCVDLPLIPREQLERLRELYCRGFATEAIG